MLVIMIIRGTSPSATPVESIPPEILARLENLDKSFHNFVAIANKRTEAAYEENSDDDSELPSEEIPTERDDPKTLAEKRWAINQTFYKEFLKKHKVPKHPTSKWYVIGLLKNSFVSNFCNDCCINHDLGPKDCLWIFTSTGLFAMYNQINDKECTNN